MLLMPTRLAIIACSHMVPYYEEGRRISVPELEERFNLNPRTLNPALRILVHAGILNSRTGGSDRGYILARDPREISLYDIVQLIQGEPNADCCADVLGCKNCISHKQYEGHCRLFRSLNRVMEFTRQEIGNISLYDQYYNLEKP